MNICIYSRPFHPSIGGLERMAFILAREFAAAGHQVEVLTDTANDDDSEIFNFRVTRTTSNFTRFLTFRRSQVILLMNMTLTGAPLGVLAGRPVVVSHHGVYETKSFGMKVYLLQNLKWRLTKYFPSIACSHFVASKLPRPSHVVPNAYDNQLFRSDFSQSQHRTFVFCGRLVSDKGADIAVVAFAQVFREFPGITLTIIGDGPELSRLKSLCSDLSCDQAVTFTGSLRGSELRDCLSAHQCVIVPSTVEEGFGLAALEGVACCGRAIVSDRGGLREAIGPCGMVVPPTAEAFVMAMKAELRRAAECAQPEDGWRQALRDHLLRHESASVARRYYEVLESAALG